MSETMNFEGQHAEPSGWFVCRNCNEMHPLVYWSDVFMAFSEEPDRTTINMEKWKFECWLNGDKTGVSLLEAWIDQVYDMHVTLHDLVERVEGNEDPYEEVDGSSSESS